MCEVIHVCVCVCECVSMHGHALVSPEQRVYVSTRSKQWEHKALVSVSRHDGCGSPA